MCPSLLAVHGPAPTRPSMASDKGALLPRPPALLGTNHGGLLAERTLFNKLPIRDQNYSKHAALGRGQDGHQICRTILLHFLQSSQPSPLAKSFSSTSLTPSLLGHRQEIAPAFPALRPSMAIGSPRSWCDCVGNVRRRAHTMWARELPAHGCAVSEPRSRRAHPKHRECA